MPGRTKNVSLKIRFSISFYTTHKLQKSDHELRRKSSFISELHILNTWGLIKESYKCDLLFQKKKSSRQKVQTRSIFFLLQETSLFQAAWFIDFERSVVDSEKFDDKCEGLLQMTNFLPFMIVLAPGLLTFGWTFWEEPSTASHWIMV